MAVQYYEGIGRRKESTARVRVMDGTGLFVVNGKTVEDYFTRFGDPDKAAAPLQAVGEDRAQWDITVVVKGGGVTGQVDSVTLGLARALVKVNPDLRSALRNAGYLTRRRAREGTQKAGS